MGSVRRLQIERTQGTGVPLKNPNTLSLSSPPPPLLSPDVPSSTAGVMVQYLANAGQGAVLDDGATIHGGDFVSSKPEQAKERWV